MSASLIAAAKALVAAVTYDDSGTAGRGGNGGLLSRETIRRSDELRIEILRLEGRVRPATKEEAR